MVDSDGDLHEYIFENDSSGDYYDDSSLEENNEKCIDDNDDFIKVFQKQKSLGTEERSD